MPLLQEGGRPSEDKGQAVQEAAVPAVQAVQPNPSGAPSDALSSSPRNGRLSLKDHPGVGPPRWRRAADRTLIIPPSSKAISGPSGSRGSGPAEQQGAEASSFLPGTAQLPSSFLPAATSQAAFISRAGSQLLDLLLLGPLPSSETAAKPPAAAAGNPSQCTADDRRVPQRGDGVVDLTAAHALRQAAIVMRQQAATEFDGGGGSSNGPGDPSQAAEEIDGGGGSSLGIGEPTQWRGASSGRMVRPGASLLPLCLGSNGCNNIMAYLSPRSKATMLAPLAISSYGGGGSSDASIRQDGARGATESYEEAAKVAGPSAPMCTTPGTPVSDSPEVLCIGGPCRRSIPGISPSQAAVDFSYLGAAIISRRSAVGPQEGLCIGGPRPRRSLPGISSAADFSNLGAAATAVRSALPAPFGCPGPPGVDGQSLGKLGSPPSSEWRKGVSGSSPSSAGKPRDPFSPASPPASLSPLTAGGRTTTGSMMRGLALAPGSVSNARQQRDPTGALGEAIATALLLGGATSRSEPPSSTPVAGRFTCGADPTPHSPHSPHLRQRSITYGADPPPHSPHSPHSPHIRQRSIMAARQLSPRVSFSGLPTSPASPRPAPPADGDGSRIGRMSEGGGCGAQGGGRLGRQSDGVCGDVVGGRKGGREESMTGDSLA